MAQTCAIHPAFTHNLTVNVENELKEMHDVCVLLWKTKKENSISSQFIFLCLASILAKERKILENRVSALRTTKVVTTSYVPDGEGNMKLNRDNCVVSFVYHCLVECAY